MAPTYFKKMLSTLPDKKLRQGKLDQMLSLTIFCNDAKCLIKNNENDITNIFSELCFPVEIIENTPPSFIHETSFATEESIKFSVSSLLLDLFINYTKEFNLKIKIERDNKKLVVVNRKPGSQGELFSINEAKTEDSFDIFFMSQLSLA